MASPRYKTTGFLRFLLFMLFFMPIGYIGVQLAKGKEPSEIMQSIKDIWGKLSGGGSSVSKGTANVTDKDLYEASLAKDEEIQKLREELFLCQQGKK
jgi:hypothetical protein